MLGVLFGDKHTYWDWGLILKSYPDISPPAPKTKIIQVPGSDVVIDLTETLTGGVVYEPRTLSFEFTLMDKRSQWPTTYSDILESLHGRRMDIVLDDDPDYCYTGRVAVDSLDADKRTATLRITAEVEPYKREISGDGRRL